MVFHNHNKESLRQKMVKIFLLILLVVFVNIAVYLTNPPKPIFPKTPPSYYLSLELTISDRTFGMMDQLRIFNTGYASFYCPAPQILDPRPGEKEAGFYEGELETMNIEALTDFLRTLPAAEVVGNTVTPVVVCQWGKQHWVLGFQDFPEGARLALARIRWSMLDRPVWTVTAEAMAPGRERWQFSLRNRGKMSVEIENPWNRPFGRSAFSFEAKTGTGYKTFNLGRDITSPETLYITLGPQQSLVMDFDPRRLSRAQLPGAFLHGFYQGKIRVGDGPLFHVRSQSKSLSDRQN